MKTLVVIQEGQKLTEEENYAIDEKFKDKESIVYYEIPKEDLEIGRLKTHIRKLIAQKDVNLVVAVDIPIVLIALAIWYGKCVNKLGIEKTEVYNLFSFHIYYENCKKIVKVCGYAHKSEKESKENEN